MCGERAWLPWEEEHYAAYIDRRCIFDFEPVRACGSQPRRLRESRSADPELATKLALSLALFYQPQLVDEGGDAPLQVEKDGDACNRYAGPKPHVRPPHPFADRASATARGERVQCAGPQFYAVGCFFRGAAAAAA